MIPRSDLGAGAETFFPPRSRGLPDPLGVADGWAKCRQARHKSGLSRTETALPGVRRTGASAPPAVPGSCGLTSSWSPSWRRSWPWGTWSQPSWSPSLQPPCQLSLLVTIRGTPKCGTTARPWHPGGPRQTSQPDTRTAIHSPRPRRVSTSYPPYGENTYGVSSEHRIFFL